MNEVITDPIVEFFSWYVLYDIPLLGLQFDFQNQNIVLIIDDCDREGQDVELRLVFKKANKYIFQYPKQDFVFEMLAIYRIHLTKIEEGYYELNLLIDMPEKVNTFGRKLGFTVGKMLIGFADMEVVGGLSREAMEYKWKVEEE